MAMDGLPEGVSPSGRVPEQLLQAAPILKWRRRRNKEEFAKKGSVLGVSTPRGNIGEGGHRGDPLGSQEASWRGLGWGRARDPHGLLVVALLRSFGDSVSFCCADFLYDFCRNLFGTLSIGKT